MCKKVSRRIFGPKGDREEEVTGRMRQLNKNDFRYLYSAKCYYSDGIPVRGHEGP
jgi:hypothetical protein